MGLLKLEKGLGQGDAEPFPYLCHAPTIIIFGELDAG
ncbi:rCG57476 [Rattus norvegicus]|uniref:RCG57476 n=1 Tax=Rattus norvegicus TaxID=10116 RepID=A6JI13_RAT|nr:rCG57476 [Rattus norvegicus]